MWVPSLSDASAVKSGLNWPISEHISSYSNTAGTARRGTRPAGCATGAHFPSPHFSPGSWSARRCPADREGEARSAMWGIGQARRTLSAGQRRPSYSNTAGTARRGTRPAGCATGAPSPARISHQGHGLRGAVRPTGKERRAARCGASGKRLDAPCRPDSAALRVAPRRPPAASRASTVFPDTLFGPLLADRTPGRDAGRDPGEKCGLA